ncbi:hypothetical protein AMELA_G00255350 [Ameiurus melas]|uniref:EF-hand domain-containing protein n=1 Tax=Ameiurus melas TaxID=219545 RepID=A0A7J5ZT84_AMEME|nr:hypothetical protein AMELA_G00255350 [Ameiurus melas]
MWGLEYQPSLLNRALEHPLVLYLKCQIQSRIWMAPGPELGSEIREAFKVFDRDGNGFISKQDLGMAMRSLGYMPNEVELEVIIKRLDMDGI